MRSWVLPLAALVVLALAGPAGAVTAPLVVRDTLTGRDTLPPVPIPSGGDPIQDYTQPDTQIEPSIAVNPANPQNVVTVYQEGRIASGGDATNGFATSFDGGATWIHGELPGLTTFPGQGGQLERASDAVVAFGPNNLVYANSLVFDFTTGGGLRSGIAVNVSKDGGRTWGPPVLLQDDVIGGLNDKNWIVVDNSDAPGHHKGRVYVVWDRVAPVVYNYCDHDCDQLGNWLPDFQTLDPVLFPAQGIGAYPLVLKSGGLGIVLDTATIGVPTGEDEPEGNGDEHVMILAPGAGQTPYPSPLAFLPPIEISPNKSNGVSAQRASDGLPAAAADPKSGALYTVWDDGRFRKDGKNDAVFSKSTDEGQTWSAAKPIDPGPRDDKVNHYNVTVSVGEDGVVHVGYRVRDESGKQPLYTDRIDTYYQQSRDGGKTWSAPLLVNSEPSRPWYGAFSRNGTFEGDYNQTASSGGYTYITRDQGAPASPGERQALTPNVPPPFGTNDPSNSCADDAGCLTLTAAGKGHQHQATWVALIRDGQLSANAGAGGPTVSTGGAGAIAVFPSRRSCGSRRAFTIHLRDPRGPERLVSARVYVNGKRVAVLRGRRLRARINLRGLPRGTFTVRVIARTNRHRRLTSHRRYHTCVPRRPRSGRRP